jgi:dUTP pyrophosphatase
MGILKRINDIYWYNILGLPRTVEPKMYFYKSRDVKSPTRGTKLSSGIDFYVPNDFASLEVKPGEQVIIPSGIYLSLDPEWSLIGFDKSGIATKKQMLIGAKVIDADYEGEIHINLHNVGLNSQFISPGEKLAQFILLKVDLTLPVEVFEKETLWGNIISERGEGKFGSTDHK